MSEQTVSEQTVSDDYLLKVRKRPWYEWILWALWFVILLFILQNAVASGAELESRATTIFWISLPSGCWPASWYGSSGEVNSRFRDRYSSLNLAAGSVIISFFWRVLAICMLREPAKLSLIVCRGRGDSPFPSLGSSVHR